MKRATRLSSATALAALALVAGAASASAGVDPTANNPATYENGGQYQCTKVEYADGLKTFTKAPGVAFYVVKAGQNVTWVDGGTVYGGTYTSTKDISFIITCVPVRSGS